MVVVFISSLIYYIKSSYISPHCCIHLNYSPSCVDHHYICMLIASNNIIPFLRHIIRHPNHKRTPRTHLPPPNKHQRRYERQHQTNHRKQSTSPLIPQPPVHTHRRQGQKSRKDIL